MRLNTFKKIIIILFFLSPVIISCAGYEYVMVDEWVQLNNSSDDTVYYWTGDYPSNTLVLPNSQATRRMPEFTMKSNDSHVDKIYLKKKNSLSEYDANSLFSFSVDEHEDKQTKDVIFTWNGTTLSRQK